MAIKERIEIRSLQYDGRKKMTFKSLLAKGVPAVLIPGIIFASIYGVKNLDKLEKYQNDKRIFPVSGMVGEVEDGDTFSLESGRELMHQIGVKMDITRQESI